MTYNQVVKTVNTLLEHIYGSRIDDWITSAGYMSTWTTKVLTKEQAKLLANGLRILGIYVEENRPVHYRSYEQATTLINVVHETRPSPLNIVVIINCPEYDEYKAEDNNGN
jgi:hypothetical protein